MKFQSLNVKCSIFAIACFLIVIFLFGITANAEQNPPPIGGGDSNGEWMIEDGDTIIRQNQEIRLKGNLTIENGGNLTLKNVTLKMNCSSDGEFKIEVQNGGSFYIYDDDNNKETNYDVSVITAYSTSKEYLFHVKEGGKMIMKNSELHECGPGGMGEEDKWGLIIWSFEIFIENNTISSNHNGIYCRGISTPRIVNNTFLKNNVDAIVVTDNSNPYIGNNYINGRIDSGRNDGIACGGSSNSIMRYNIIDDCSTGIGFYGSAKCEIVNTTIKNCRDGMYTSGVDSANLTLTNCSFENNGNWDIWFNDEGYCNITVINITSGDFHTKFKEGSKAERHDYFFLDVKVIDDENQVVSDANIRVRDNSNGDYNETFTTNDNGWKRWILLLVGIARDGGGTGYAPFTVDVSKDGRTVTKDDLSYWQKKSLELEMKIDFKLPEISNIQTKDITGDSITITWETNKDCDSRLKYGYDQNYDMDEYKSVLVKSHSIKITNLDPDTTYHFCVNSTDDYGNTNESADFIFKTMDTIPPEITNIKNSTPSGTSIIISWNTDEASDSTVEYGLDENYGNIISNESLVTSHTITLTDLFPDTLYHFCVKSTDNKTNTNVSSDFTFKTLDTVPPEIYDIKNSTPTGTSVTITWSTNELSDSLVNYGLDTNYGLIAYDPILTNFHNITITDLNSETLYHFCVNSTDANNNKNQSIDFTFKTQDITPPEIFNIDVIEITHNSAKISWNTNEPSNSILKYGKTVSYGLNKTNEDLVTDHVIELTGLNDETTYHFCVNSTDESNNSNQSEDFNFKTLDITTPEIFNIDIIEITDNSAKISWNTNEPSNSLLKYGKTVSYGLKKINQDVVTDHVIELTDLNSETTYHFCVNSTDESNNSNQSGDFTFKTLDITPPEITNIDIFEITHNSAKVLWDTNEPSKSIVKYGKIISYGLIQSNDDLVKSHLIELTHLSSESLYHFCINSTDESNNSNQSEDYTFETKDINPPENPNFKPENGSVVKLKRPVIIITFAEIVNITEVKLNKIDISSNLKTEDNIIFTYTPINDLPKGENTISIKAKDQNGNEMNNPAISVFTIDSIAPEITEIEAIDISQNSVTITWKTNEPCKSQVEYGKADTYGELTDEDNNFTTIHNITITGLEIGTTYHYRVISEDEHGNENISEDYSFKTLEKTEEPDIDVKLEITPTEIKKGDEVTIKAMITNKGTVTIEFDVVCMVDDKKIDEKKITIEPGKSGSSSITWKAEEGNHTINVVVKQNDKEVKNGTVSNNVEVKKASDDSAFNIIYLIPIIIIPIVVGLGLFLRNRGGDQSRQTIQQPQMQQSIPEEAWQQKPQTPVVQPTTQPITPPTAQPAVQICPYCNVQVPGEFSVCNMCGKQIKN